MYEKALVLYLEMGTQHMADKVQGWLDGLENDSEREDMKSSEANELGESAKAEAVTAEPDPEESDEEKPQDNLDAET